MKLRLHAKKKRKKLLGWAEVEKDIMPKPWSFKQLQYLAVTFFEGM